MKINIELIKSFKPCEDRLLNYSNHYAHKDFTLDQFGELKKITEGDKIWVLSRLLTQDQAVVFCLDASLRCLNADASDSSYAASDSSYDAASAASDSSYAARAASCAASDASDSSYAARAASYAVRADSFDAFSTAKESIQILVAILKGEFEMKNQKDSRS